MSEEKNNLELLYNAVSDKFDIGTYESFQAKMDTPEKRKNFYSAVSDKGFDLGDYSAYEERLSVKKKDEIEVGETPSEVGVSEEEELTSTLPEEPPEGFRTVAERGKGLVDPIEKAEVPVEEFKEREDILLEEQRKAKEAREARLTQNREIAARLIPEIDTKLEQVAEQRKDVYSRQRDFMMAQEGFAVPDKEQVEAFETEIKDINKQNIYLNDAKDILEKAERYAKTSDAGVFESMFKGSLGKDFFSLGVSELIRDVNILDVVKKQQAGEKLSDAEQMGLYAYAVGEQIKGDVDPNVASMIGSGVRESIPFMIQMALTSPGGAAAKKSAQEGMEAFIKKMGKKELNKYVKGAVGATARAGVQAFGQTDLYTGTAKEQIGQVTPKAEGGYEADIDPTTQMTAAGAFGKQYAKMFGTMLIERSGGLADDLLKKASNRAVQQNVSKNLTGRTLDKITDATGLNNVASEFAEEIVDAYKEAAFEGEFDPTKIYTGKELLAMLGSVAMISGPIQVANMVNNRNTDDRAIAVNSLKDAESQLMPKTVAEVDRILQGDDIQKNAEQMDIYLKTKKAEGATDEDISKVVNYAAQRQRMDGITEAEADVLEAQKEKAAEKIKETAEKEEKAPEVVTPQVEEKVAEKASKIDVEPKIKKDGKDERKGAEVSKTRQKRIEERLEGEKVSEGQKVLEGEPEGVAKVFERPEMEYPVSRVVIAGKSRFIQRREGMSPSETGWYEVQKDETGTWQSTRQGKDTDFPVGYTKAEVISDFKKEADAGKVEEIFRDEKEIKIEKPIKREAIDQRAVEARARIGDVVVQKPTQLVKKAKSVAELDYLNTLYPGEFTAKEYKDKKARLEKKGLLEDTEGRIADIEAQAMESKAKDIDISIEGTLGVDRYAGLKEKRAAEVDRLVNSLGNLANIKRAVGDGKKLDVGRELVQVASSLAKLGMINVELGTKVAMDKLRDFLSEHAPNQVADLKQHENLIARELGTRVADKKLAEAGVSDVTKKATAKVQARKQAEQEVNKLRKKSFKDIMQRYFVDQANPFKIALLKKGGPLAQRAVDYFNTQSGMSGRSEAEFSAARKKILGSFKDIMNENEQNALAEYLNYKRSIELDKLYDKRGQNRLEHEGGVTMEEAEVTLDALMKNDPDMLAAHNITEPVDWKKVETKAQEYWNTLQSKLADMYQEGLISEEVYNKLKKEQPHYSPRQYVDKFSEVVDPGGSISGIEALSGGSTGSILTDIQTLLADAISRANNAIARNRTMRALHDVATDTPNDVIKPGVYKQTRTVDGKKQLGYLDKLKKEEERLDKLREKLKKEGRKSSEIDAYIEAEQRYIEPEFEAPPQGYETFKFKDDGQTKAIYLDRQYSEDFVGAPDARWVQNLKNVLGWVSGTKILKAFATGYNPEFAVKNLPLDMMHILTTTEAYSPVYPVATAQLAKDIAKVAKDAWKRTGRYKDFVEEGGSLEYLATQGSLSPRKFKNYNKLNVGIQGLLSGAQHIQNTSEIVTRLALRERMIENYTKDFEKKEGRKPNTQEKKEIQQQATAYARNYLDFAQGGKAIKFMNSVVPYLNAGFQVTRGTLRAAQRNPKIFWSKIAQLGATATAITAYNLGMFSSDDDEQAQERKQYYLNDISDRRKADNFVIMTNINYEKDGKKHYVYFTFPKDNAQKTMAGWFEGTLAAATGEKGQLINERRWMELQSLVQNVADLGNLPPVQSAILGSTLNKDLYYRTDLWSGRDMGKYKSQEYMPGTTPTRFIKAGEMSEKVSEALGFEGSFSPVRMQYFVSQFTTKSNVIGTMMGEVLDATMGGLDKETEEFINKTVGEQLVTQPFSRRFFKKTSPYVKKSHAKEEMQKINAERQRNDNKLKPFLKAEDYTGALKVVFEQEDPIEMQRLLQKVQDDLSKMQNIDYRIRELQFSPPKARARAFHKMWKEADKAGRKKLVEGSALMGYFGNAEFMGEITQLMSGDVEFTLSIEQ